MDKATQPKQSSGDFAKFGFVKILVLLSLQLYFSLTHDVFCQMASCILRNQAGAVRMTHKLKLSIKNGTS